MPMPMQIRSLRTRFLLAGGLLAAVLAACGAWSVVTFARLSAVIGDTLRSSQQKIDLTAMLASALEREDDALLVALAGDAGRARGERDEQRRHFEDAFARLRVVLTAADERSTADQLREHVDAYRRAVDDLLNSAGPARDRATYHERVNPALRKAVADCGRLRELSFAAMRQSGIDARNQADRASVIIAGLSLAALAGGALVALRLARAVLRPIRELTRGVEAIRDDDFAHRVRVDAADELGRLAEGFNRMAVTLSAYRQSSLGELLLAKTMLESTLAVLPDAVFLVDPDGGVAPQNRLAEAILQTNGDVPARRFQDLPLPAGVQRAVDETLRGGRAGARPDLSQAWSIRAASRTLRMLATVTPIPEFRPRRRGAVLVLADVTDFARLDELRSELVAVASHELRTPLTSLRMNLLLLRERAENLVPCQAELLAAAVLAGEELAATIDELLDLTRIEAGQLRLQRERVEIDALIEQTLRSLRPRFEDASIRLCMHYDADSAVVAGDAARLRIVLVNLLDNALKYTPAGGEVVVRVASPGEAAGGRSRLQIIVTDTGPGIPAEFRERVFEKFFRVAHQQETETEGVRGAGIGLYLCRQIVAAHGGSLHCEPGEQGRGTRFVLQLDRAEADVEG